MITNNILLYSSRPEFIYYFDPHLDIQTKIGYDKYGIFPYIRIGFFDKGKDTLTMAGVIISSYGGWLAQGYYKDDKLEYYGRQIYYGGESNTGGYKQGRRNGKGEWKKADGSREIAYYVDYGKKEGAAKYYDKKGNEQDRFYENGMLVYDSGNFIDSDSSDDFEDSED